MKSGILISATIISVITLNLAHILRNIPEFQQLSDVTQWHILVNCSSIDYFIHMKALLG